MWIWPRDRVLVTNSISNLPTILTAWSFTGIGTLLQIFWKGLCVNIYRGIRCTRVIISQGRKLITTLCQLVFLWGILRRNGKHIIKVMLGIASDRGAYIFKKTKLPKSSRKKGQFRDW